MSSNLFKSNKKEWLLRRLFLLWDSTKAKLKDKNTYIKLTATKFVLLLSALCCLAVYLYYNSQVKASEERYEKLLEKIELLEKEYQRDSTEYSDLKDNKDLLEHIAREHYMMKQKDEIVYIIQNKVEE